MTAKAFCNEKYLAQRTQLGRKPTKKEFLAYAGFGDHTLERLYGGSPYVKLQVECGDAPNKLEMTRTPLEEIMAQYGDLALELQALPAGADWTQKRCRPSVSGLGKKPHHIDWSEMSQKFRQWALANAPAKYKGILDLIPDRQSAIKQSRQSAKLSTLLADIRAWSPARRRNTEGEYKIELRKKLEELRYAINEEFGESNSDLVVEKAFDIETKKDPQLSDFDRLFGQVARHLQLTRSQVNRPRAIVNQFPHSDLERRGGD